VCAAHITFLLQTDLLFVGTGDTSLLLDKDLVAELKQHGIRVESMSSRAAVGS
jgi:uncharacterized protein